MDTTITKNTACSHLNAGWGGGGGRGGGHHRHGQVGHGQHYLPTVDELDHHCHRRDPPPPLLLTTAGLHHPTTECPYHNDDKQCRDECQEPGEAGKGARYLGPPDLAPLPAGGAWLSGARNGDAGCGQPAPKSAAVAVRALYRSMSAAVGPAGGAAAGAAGATIGSGGEEPSAGSAAAGGADGTLPAGVTVASGREPPSEGMGGNPAMVRWEEEGARKSETGMGEDGAEGKVSSIGHCCGRWEQRGLWTTVQRAPQGLASQQGCLIDTPDGQEPGQ